jgi:hypothetical protein
MGSIEQIIAAPFIGIGAVGAVVAGVVIFLSAYLGGVG